MSGGGRRVTIGIIGDFDRCSFETNADFIPRWEAAGLRVAARGPGGEMRALELPAKAFHVATLFQPQLPSSFARPHPIVEGFLRACVR